MIFLFDCVIHQGVPAFAITLFFTKLISYTFLDWLPYYIKYTRTRSISCFHCIGMGVYSIDWFCLCDAAIDGVYLSTTQAAYLSTFFDVGGVIGMQCV